MGVSSGSVRAGSAYVEVNLKSNVSKQARAVQVELQVMANSFRSLGGAISGIGTKTLAAMTGTLASLVFPVSLAAQAESTRVSFETLTKSTVKTAKLLKELRSFAASTPFEFGELSDSAKKLLAFGSSTGQVVSELTMLGDIASGIGIPLSELSELYGKSRVEGRVMAEDLNQWVGKGVPLIQAFAQQFGVAESEIRKLTENGQIGFANLETALRSMTSAGGLFAGGMAKQAETLSGKWSTLKDDISAALLPIGEALLPLLKQFVSKASETAQKIAAWVKENQELIPSYAELVVKITAGAAAVTLFGKGLQLTSGLLGGAADLVRTLAKAYEFLSNAFSGIAAVTTANAAATSLSTRTLQANTAVIGQNGITEVAHAAAINTTTAAIVNQTVATVANSGAVAANAAAHAAAATAAQAASVATTESSVAFAASAVAAQAAVVPLTEVTAGYIAQSVAITNNTRALIANAAARSLTSGNNARGLTRRDDNRGLTGPRGPRQVPIDVISITTNAAAPITGAMEAATVATTRSAGIISRIISGLAGAVTGGFSSMGTAIAGFLGPVGLAAAAIAALSAAYLYVVNRSGLLTDALGAISKVATELGETINRVAGGIVKALSLGEYQRAVNILVIGIKLSLLQGFQAAVDAGTYILHNFGKIMIQWATGILQSIDDLFRSIPRIIAGIVSGSESIGEIVADVLMKNTDGLIARSVQGLKDDLAREIATLEKIADSKKKPEQKQQAEQQVQQQAQQAKPVQAQQAKPELSEGSKAIRERIKALRDEMEVLRYGEDIAERRKLKAQGATDTEIRVLMIEQKRQKQMQEQHDVDVKLTEDADALRESLKTPLDEFKQQIQSIDKLYAAGKISKDTRDQAKEKAREQVTADVLPKSPIQEFKKRVEEIRQMVAQRIISPDQGEQAVAQERAKITQSVTGTTQAITGQSTQAANLFRTQLAGTSGDKTVMLSKRQLAVQERQEKLLATISKKPNITVSRAMLN